MQMMDKVVTPDGIGTVVGFPIVGSVEVRFGPERGGQLDIFNEVDVKVVGQETEEDDVPRSASGRRLSGAALKRHQAAQERQEG